MTRVSRVRLARAWGPSTSPTACTLVGRLCALWGWQKGVPRGAAFLLCEGRLGSGAPPPRTACPPGGLSGSTIHVLLALVCRCGGPALSPWVACPVEAACRGGGRGPSPGGGPQSLCGVCGSRRCPSPRRPSSAVLWTVGVGVGTLPLPHGLRPCGHLRKGAPVGGAFRRCEGRLGSGAPPPPPTCCRRGCGGVGAQHCPLGSHALWGLRAAGLLGAVPGGVACHRCEGASGVRRCLWPGRLSPGAGSRGSATCVCRVRSARAWGPSTVPTACALAGWR